MKSKFSIKIHRNALMSCINHMGLMGLRDNPLRDIKCIIDLINCDCPQYYDTYTELKTQKILFLPENMCYYGYCSR